MKTLDLEAMPLHNLWDLHGRISIVLSKRILAEKRQLEGRLTQLNQGKVAASALSNLKSPKRYAESSRRPYPRVFPKYQNPRGALGNLVGAREATAVAGFGFEGRCYR